MGTRPDSMLVETDHLVAANQEVAEQGQGQSLSDLSQREPALAAYLQEGLAALAGRLCLSGAPSGLVKSIHDEALHVALTCVEAMRRGHYALWRGTVVGTRLEELAATAKPAPRKRKRKKDAGDEGPEKGT
jgi:hypothetical protein